MTPLIRIIAPRVLTGLATALGVTLLVFFILRAVPGDPVELMLGESASAVSRESLRNQLGLNSTLPQQLRDFAIHLIHGDLGESLTRHKPVALLIAECAPSSAALAFSASLIANLIGIPMGSYSASRRREWKGKFIFAAALVFVSFPVFWLGPLLVVAFALRWPWLPISSFYNWSAIILPALAIGLGLAGYLAQTTRAAVAHTLKSDFIRTAAAKGASPSRILFCHALPASAVPIITVSALQFGHLLAGAVITETVFDWPGIGRLLYDAIMQRDYPTVQGVVLVISTTYVIINSLTDILNSRFSPR